MTSTSWDSAKNALRSSSARLWSHCEPGSRGSEPYPSATSGSSERSWETRPCLNQVSGMWRCVRSVKPFSGATEERVPANPPRGLYGVRRRRRSRPVRTPIAPTRTASTNRSGQSKRDPSLGSPLPLRGGSSGGSSLRSSAESP